MIGSRRMWMAAAMVSSALLLTTAAGGSLGSPSLVKDINPGSASSAPQSLTNVNGTLLFRATTSTNDVELWRSNGTAAGTTRVRDIALGAAGSNPTSLTNVNGTLLFSAGNGFGDVELWRSDGTEAGTTRVKDASRWQEFGNVPEPAFALLGQGRCLLALGELGAEVPLAAARALFASMGYRPALAETEALLEQAAAPAS